MDEEQYSRLITYVESGGILLMTAIQTRTDEKETPRPTLFRNGLISELFGVRILGPGQEIVECRCEKPVPGLDRCVSLYPVNQLYADLSHRSQPIKTLQTAVDDAEVMVRENRYSGPVLTRKRLGKGHAWLFTTDAYPGHPLLLPWLKKLLSGILMKNRPRVFVEAPDSVQWVHFPEKGSGIHTVAALNTDWTEKAGPVEIFIQDRSRKERYLLHPGQIRLVRIGSGLWVSAEDEDCGIRIVPGKNGESAIELIGFGLHNIDIRTVKKVRIHPHPAIRLRKTSGNHIRLQVKPDGPLTITLDSH